MRMLEQPETAAESAVAAPVQPVSRLRNWPVQIKLAPIHAPYFEGAKLLIAADCTAYAYANFHQEFMRGKVTLIGCPSWMLWIQRKADRDPAQQRYPERDHPPHGGALLRRLGDGGEKGASDQRKVHSVAGGHHLH